MNILVVIDNVYQYERIKNVFEFYKNSMDFVVDFKHSIVKSAIWDHPYFSQNNSSIVDVKKNVEELIVKYDLIFSVHCFQFFPKKLVENVRCINIHPGYNPINRGWYPQVFSIIYSLPIGATIHEMDSKLDHGPIIAREYVEKHLWDTSESIYWRVLNKEIELFERYFIDIINNKYSKIIPDERGNLFTKKDFLDIQHIDLDKKDSFHNFYNLLRALSHGKYKNAFIIDKETGKKIYLKLEIEYE